MASKRRSRPPINPADGERRAIRGFSAQYEIAAILIYDALLEGDLEWVRIADPDAGRLDDVLIARSGRLDGYQVKWGEYEQRISFRDLVTASSAGGRTYPSPISLLADGWKRLRKAYPDRLLKVRYLTRSSPSSDDDVGASAPSARHLQAFLRHAFAQRDLWFEPAGADTRRDWAAPIDAIMAAADLEEAERARFLAACELDLGYRVDRTAGTDRASQRRSQDIDSLAAYLQRAVAGEGRIIEISRSDLLGQLGWNGRFDLSFKHDFPVDTRLYRPVHSTISALERTLSRHRNGYVALIGPPGSGKSTTLTQVLRYRPGVRAIRYYAFVRGDARQGRGEAYAFLHDLCLSLERLGVGRRHRRQAQPATLDELQEHLSKLFAELGEEWKRDSVQTILLVDGLDHIEREQQPSRSLIDVLPHPDSLPEGVLVVLGTQQVGLESTSPAMRPIRAQLASYDRTISMARLERNDVFSIVSTAIPDDLLADGNTEAIYAISGGHPLALSYLVKRIASLNDQAQVTPLLEGSVAYDGDIELDYRTYWETLRGDDAICDLFGLISRIRGAVDLAVLERLADDRVLRRFVTTASHYFQKETPSRWTFFHNSFRQFLIRETEQNAFRKSDLGKASGFHRRLASVAESMPADSPFAWERLHHLDAAGDPDAVLRLFTQQYFRQQFMALRPIAEIIDDIDLCLKAADSCDDRVAAIRAVLIDHELRERSRALNESDLPALLLEVAGTGEIGDAMFNGLALRVPAPTAMAFAGRLLDRGDEALARRAFDAAEPLDLLRGVRHVAESGPDADLDNWIVVAWRFRSLSDVFKALRNLRAEPGRGRLRPIRGDDQDIVEELRARLLHRLGSELISYGEFTLLDEAEAELRALGEPKAEHLLLDLDIQRLRGWADGAVPAEIGRDALERLLGGADELHPTYAVAMADLILRLGGDRTEVERLLLRASSPLLAVDFDRWDDETLAPVVPLIVQARAMAAFGRPLDPVTSVPSEIEVRQRGDVLFQRMAILVGSLWGDAIRGNRHSPSEVVRRLGPALTLFQRPFAETRDWTSWMYIERRAPAFYEAVLRAAQAHGEAALSAVFDALRSDWQRARTPQRPSWRLDWRRAVVVSVHALLPDPSRTAALLDALEREISVDYELDARISEYRAHVLARLALDDTARVKSVLMKMLATSFGIYHHKDYQIERWAHWLERFARTNPSDKDLWAAFELLLKAMPTVHQSHRGDGISDAQSTLLAALARHRPNWTYAVSRWLLSEGFSNRDATYSGIVRGCLTGTEKVTADAAVIATSRLVIPFTSYFDNDLARAIKEAADRSDENAVAAFASERLAQCVMTKAFTNHRDAWLSVIRSSPQPPDDDAAFDSEHDPAGKKPRGLTLADGRRLTESELLGLAADPSAFQSAIDSATSAESVNWTKILPVALPPIRDAHSIRKLREGLRRLHMSLHGDSLIAAHAATLGLREIATELKDAVLAASNPHGWSERYDGGTRLAAARCLIAVDGEEGRRRAFTLFVNDYIESLSAETLLLHLDPIIEILFEHAPTEAIWREITVHVQQLAEVAESDAVLPPVNRQPELSHADLLVRLVLDELDSPAPAIVAEARKGIIDLMSVGVGVASIDAHLRQRLGGDDAQQRRALEVLVQGSRALPNWVASYTAELEGIAWAPSAVVRRLSHQVLQDVGRDLPPAPTQRPLPSIYSLHLPPAFRPEQPLRGDDAPAGQPLPNTDDAIDLARLFEDPFRLLAQGTGLAYEAIASRYVTIMRSLGPANTWSSEAEAKLREHLNSIRLPIAFTRPRAAVGFRAFGLVLAELVDAGRVPQSLPVLDSWLLTVDALLSRRDPTQKPEWVALPVPKDVGGCRHGEWLEHPEEALPLATRRIPRGGLVLAELTMIHRVDGDGRPQESRASMLANPQHRLRSTDHPGISYFHHRRHFVAADYPYLHSCQTPSPVIAGGPYFVEPGFVALNPQLGFHLNWTPAEAGLFRWLNVYGETMAESIWWQQGNLSLLDRHGYETASAEGWLVIATEAGAHQLSGELKNYKRCLSARRAVHDGHSNEREKLAQAEERV